MAPAEGPPRVFVDANVLFSAAYRAAGRSRTLFIEAERGRCRLISSQHAVVEARRNLAVKRAECVPVLDHLARALELGPAHSPAMVERAVALGFEQGDAVILAGAAAGRADWLVTGDKAFWKAAHAVRRALGVEVLSQGQALDRLV